MKQIVLLIVAALLAACRSAPDRTTTLTVFAAASLTEAFKEIGAQYEAAHSGVKIDFNFAGSQQLRRQLEQGAPADVVASANHQEIDAVIEAGLIVSGTSQVFARNRLTVIVPKDNRAGVETLADLAKPRLKIVLAASNVPAGGYALAALEKLNQPCGATFSATVLSNVVSYEDNVKQVVAKVQLGEADAGIVYTSDVTPVAAEKVTALDIPDQFNVNATYPIASLRSAPQPDLAAGFVKFVLSSGGQSILKKWGFITQ